MHRFVSLLWLAAVLPGWGQFDSDLAPRELDRREPGALPFQVDAPIPVPEAMDRSEILSAHLGIIELKNPENGFPMGHATFVPLNTVAVIGLTIPEPDALITVVGQWLGKPLTEQSLDRLTDVVLAHYQKHDRPVVDIAVPEQDLSKGRLSIEIVEGRIGLVGMEKTEYFNNERIGKGIHLEEGQVLTASALQAQLDWLNRNPFRSASVYAAPGVGVAEADFVFTLEEEDPWRFYLGYENSGTKAAGEHRLFGGMNWGNAFDLDHLLGYQFTVGESLEQFQAHSISYEIPLHERHRFLRFHGTWADVEAVTSAGGVPLLASGETWQASVAYGILLPRWNGMSHEVTIGAEYKSTNNFLNFGGGGLPGSTVEIVQARLDYRASKRWERDALNLQAVLVASPGGLGGNNDDASFEAFRSGASADYLYANAKATWLRRLSQGWSLRVEGEGQVASGPLLAIEQLAFGGHATVRGYAERGYLADSGYLLSTELRAPAWELPFGEKAPSKVQLLGFVDHGTGWLEGGANESFSGAGAGLRVQAEERGELRFDVAWPLDGGGGPEAHVGVLLTF